MLTAFVKSWPRLWATDRASKHRRYSCPHLAKPLSFAAALTGDLQKSMSLADVMRTPIVAGNWKMNGSIASVDALIQGLVSSEDLECELLVCPPTVFLSQVRDRLIAKKRGSVIVLGAQDVSQHEAGAHTGEVSADMLSECGCRYTLIGHSERRQFHAESDINVAAKVERSLTAGIRPIVCVGETLEERQNGYTLSVVERQLDAVGEMISAEDWGRFDVAYEPVWAIGNGESASPEQAQEVHEALRSALQKNGDQNGTTRILYGGSVNQDNADALFEMADIDGALVGGASLVAESFLSIAASAAVRSTRSRAG